MRHRYGIRLLVCGIIAATLALGLGACHVASRPIGALTPTPKTNTAPMFGATSGPVAAVVDKQRYAPADTIVVTIHNGLAAPIFARAGRSDCTLVDLDRWVNGSWQIEAHCGNALPTPHALRIAPGAVLTQQLAPGQSDFAPDLWLAGTYRIAYPYVTSPDQPVGQGTVVYSASFVVG
jgi:hypothetical protein